MTGKKIQTAALRKARPSLNEKTQVLYSALRRYAQALKRMKAGRITAGDLFIIYRMETIRKLIDPALRLYLDRILQEMPDSDSGVQELSAAADEFYECFRKHF